MAKELRVYAVKVKEHFDDLVIAGVTSYDQLSIEDFADLAEQDGLIMSYKGFRQVLNTHIVETLILNRKIDEMFDETIIRIGIVDTETGEMKEAE